MNKNIHSFSNRFMMSLLLSNQYNTERVSCDNGMRERWLKYMMLSSITTNK